MKSLTELGLPLYPEYTQDDINYMKPSRTHRLIEPGNYTTYQTFSMISYSTNMHALPTSNKISMFNDMHRTLISSFVANLLEKGSRGLNSTWRSDIMYDIVSLSVYHTILTRVKLMNLGKWEPVISDVVKTGTIIYVSNILNGKQIGAGMISMLTGILFYHLAVREPLLKLILDKTTLNRSVVEGIEDSIETALLLSLDGKVGSIPYHIAGLICYYYLIRMN